jgi:cytochrome P450
VSTAFDGATLPDFADPTTFDGDDLDLLWEEMRQRHPAYWQPPTPVRPGFWVFSRYDDISALYRDSENFTSERGNVLSALLTGADTGAGRMLAVTDGSRHRELRSVMAKAFAPRVLDTVARRVQTNAAAVFASLAERDGADIAVEVGEYLPMTTICDLLGVPEEDRPFLLASNQAALSAKGPGHSELDERIARNEILSYFADLAEDAREEPGDDVLGVLAASRVDGEYLNVDDIALNCYSLILGGDETSRLSISSAVLALMRNPDQLAWLRGPDADLDRATEEVLRWATPAMHFGRRAVRDVIVAGRQVRAGDIVTMWNSSADRDPEVFADPHRFDLARSPNRHLAFGLGKHFCIGAFLARVEIRAVLEQLRTFPHDFAPAGAPVRLRSNFLTGLSSLPVRFTSPTR